MPGAHGVERSRLLALSCAAPDSSSARPSAIAASSGSTLVGLARASTSARPFLRRASAAAWDVGDNGACSLMHSRKALP